MIRVLVVDDVAPMAEQYAYDLARVGEYDTLVARSGAEGLDLLASEAIDCVILDLEMPVLDGFGVLQELKRREVDVPVIVYTGTGDFDRCIRAVRLGAEGFIDKDEPIERVVREIENVLERRRLRHEVHQLSTQLGGSSALVGSSPAMQRLKETLMRLAPIPSPALIFGESGSGKEIVARELHRLGPAGDAPFVAVNSAALPDHLIESELFGHERGSFTGANRLRRGAFETAANGTLFLDEVGELSQAAQAKLLRVLEERVVTRVGGDREIPVRARVVAASNRDLEVEVSGGRFREDLYYRLNVHMIAVPPLRDRRSDIPELTDHLIAVTCRRFGMRVKSVSPEARERLADYDWRRNNVRELRNTVERMIIAADGDTIESRHVPPGITDGVTPRPRSRSGQTFQEQKAEAERQIVVEALERNGWHVTKTAQALGLADHASLLKIMRRHNIVRPE
ncbi:MAG: sigma-54 dependent transcriptional regulator [Gemmatimonadetes bacterium]|nr:sigma-54 dependent transcriptional regulator [Gemmatimonadota bacterium]